MAGKIKFIRAVTGGAAAVGILTLGIFPGFPLVDGLSQSPATTRHLDASRIVVNVRPHFTPSDYPRVYKVRNSDGVLADASDRNQGAGELKERDLSARDSVEVASSGNESAKPSTESSTASSNESGVPLGQQLALASPAPSVSSKTVEKQSITPAPQSPTPVVSEKSAATDPAATQPAPASKASVAPKASVVTVSNVPDISLVPVHDGSAILRITSTAPLSFSSFRLKSPARLVIDVKGTFHHKGAAKIALDASGVSRVRAGKHPGTFRVVLDLAGADTPVPEIRATDAGLEVLAPQKTAGLDS